jgi:uncharacterized membrane protein YgdD (TMEM256/DUF423 family)
MDRLIHRPFLVAAGLFGAAGVATGAFAAHGLAALKGAAAAALWVTASQYLLIHAAVLLVLAFQGGRLRWLRRSGRLFIVGNILFGGALFSLGWFGPSPMGAVAPVGGISTLAGWLCIALQTARPFDATATGED